MRDSIAVSSAPGAYVSGAQLFVPVSGALPVDAIPSVNHPRSRFLACLRGVTIGVAVRSTMPITTRSRAASPRYGRGSPKVIVTKIGFDGHDRGSRIVAAFLRDAGMEVIYTALAEVPTLVKLAIEEDAEVIGISSLATDHLLVPR